MCGEQKKKLPCQGSNLESFAVQPNEVVGERLAIGPQGIIS